MEARCDGDRPFWTQYAATPYVQDEIKASESFRDLLRGKGKPEREIGESFSKYREDFQRFGQKRDAAREFLSFRQKTEQAQQ